MLKIIFVIRWITLMCLFSSSSANIPKGLLKYEVNEEQHPGLFIGNLSKDADAKALTKGATNILFKFTGKKKYTELFSIHNTTGILRTAKRLDRESLCNFKRFVCAVSLDVFISAPGTKYYKLIGITIVIKDLNDNLPQFPQDNITLFIPESSSKGTRYRITEAIDKDVGQHGHTSYKILIDDKLKFGLVKTISGLHLILNEKLDKESKDYYKVIVEAYERVDRSRKDSLTVIIKVLDVNERPIFNKNLYSVELLENITSGNVILHPRAKDLDAGSWGSLRYTLDDNGDKLTRDSFVLNKTTGEISIRKELDFEIRRSYNFVVVASDMGNPPLSTSVPVVVTVRDVNDNFPDIQMQDDNFFEISESAEVDSLVVQFSAIDKDSGENGEVLCSLNTTKFSLNMLAPGLYALVLKIKFNIIQRKFYDISVTCSDKGNNPKSSTKRVHIKVIEANYFAPKFTKDIYSVQMYENNVQGKALLVAKAFDNDKGRSGEIRYSISKHSTQYFDINSDNGTITVKYSLNRERPEEEFLNVTVYATDFGKPPNSGTSLVSLQVLDLNDNKPIFGQKYYEFDVIESPSSTYIGRVKATDLDIEENGLVAYTINPKVNISSDVIISESGLITTSGTLDRETNSSFVFNVNAFDHGTPKLKTSVRVKVNVKDINDNRPVVRLYNKGVIQISSTFPVQGVITKIDAYDLDLGENSTLLYTILNSAENSEFAIHNTSGHISLMKTLSNAEYNKTLRIHVTDSGRPPLSTDETITLVILPPNDGSRIISKDNNNLVIVVVMVSVSTLVSLIIVGAIYILHTKRRNHIIDKYPKLSESATRLNSGISETNTTNSDSLRYHQKYVSQLDQDGKTTIAIAPDVLVNLNNSNIFDLSESTSINKLASSKSIDSMSTMDSHIRRTNHNREASLSSQEIYDISEARLGLRNSAQMNQSRRYSNRLVYVT